MKEEVTVAKAIRVETDSKNGKTLLVFEVTHPQFKKEIMTNWYKNSDCHLVWNKVNDAIV